MFRSFQMYDTVIGRVYRLCYAHHRCDYHLSPYYAIIIPDSIPYAAPFIPWLTHPINGTHYLFLIQTFYFGKTGDSHAIVRNDAERSHTPFTQFPLKGNSLQNYDTTRMLTLLQPRSRTILLLQESQVALFWATPPFFSHSQPLHNSWQFCPSENIT